MNATRDDYIPPHTLCLLRDFLHRSRSTWSPQEAIAGDGRNAWRDLALLLPGERYWITATRLRAQQNQQLEKLPVSPADALTAAAKAMSHALNAAVLLIDLMEDIH